MDESLLMMALDGWVRIQIENKDRTDFKTLTFWTNIITISKINNPKTPPAPSILLGIFPLKKQMLSVLIA
jgi:hypothetical protein